MEPRGLERFMGRQLGFDCAWRRRAQGNTRLEHAPSVGSSNKRLGPFLLSDNRHFWSSMLSGATDPSVGGLFDALWLSVPLQAGVERDGISGGLHR
jgi:hypothetical protein